MAARLFSLIIGIDKYKSGQIWNLESCVDDAKRVQHWLIHDLNVPRDQICLLSDETATKQAIEDHFMRHLVNNPAIEHGDAILVYFAGHGSTIAAPKDWFDGETQYSGNVDVLCSYDYDTKHSDGRVTGISDRSMHALLRELCGAKGDNVMLILDCCFSPFRSPANIRDRRRTRWTPTSKATPNDLFAGLWVGARGQKFSRDLGFYQPSVSTHTLVAAGLPGQKAVEGKEGGKLTVALLDASKHLSLHRTTYAQLVDYLSSTVEGQTVACVGRHKNRIVFNGTPFVADARYIPVGLDGDKRLRIEIGTIHGIVEGSEFTVHHHNLRGSLNKPIGNVKVWEVHPTWSLCKSQRSDQTLPQRAWGRILRWNNWTPFRVHLKKTIPQFFRRWRLCRKLPTMKDKTSKPTECGINILRVKRAAEAHISLGLFNGGVSVERNDDTIIDSCPRTIRIIPRKNTLDLITDAARFHLHLHQRHPDNPLQNLVQMELYQLDPESWKRVGRNLLENGKATLAYERDAAYAIIIHNQSNVDLWPFLAFMDPSCYGITMLYHADPTANSAPLRKRGKLEIGTGDPGSEGLSFVLPDNQHFNSGFLKLFISSSFVPMGMIEQGPSIALLGSRVAQQVNNVWGSGDDSLWNICFTRLTVTREN